MKRIGILKFSFGVAALSMSLLTISCSSYGEQKTFNGTQVFYTSAVTLSDVDRLGEYLVDSGFADGEEKSVQLNKTGNTYEFRMVVKKGIEQDQEYRNLGKLLAAEISENCFNGSQVDTHFCDENLKTLIVLPMATY
ncbi:MAG: hypothetical protein LBE02_00915 [Spirochaetaceae bacterium]|jgi:hypothetical protein|nr:hypothetical protein [Spirochaetaceae bacterium]